ncbi:hypothetical protein JXO52_07845 [bacterium]|nr:hypothetical protein [bacterium]
MHIDTYRFGRMVIDGTGYTADLILHPDRIETDWRRRQGHVLAGEDILPAVEAGRPAHLVVGTGTFGLMNIDRGLEEQLAALHIDLHAAVTGKAVDIYNRLSSQRMRVMAAFHLTC